MDDANLETGAETATNDAISDSDDLTQRLAELVESDNAPEESTVEGAEEGQPDNDKPEPESEPIYTVKVDGQEIQVKQSELLAGYQRDSDYRNKTKEVSEQRRAVEAERQSVVEARNSAIQVAERFQQELGQMLQPNVDWGKLAAEDPAEYVRQKHIYDMRMSQYNQAEQAKQYLQAQAQNEQQQNLQQYIRTEQERLAQALPEWKDESKAKAGKTAMREYLQSFGYNDAEIGTVADHRMVVIADKARRYDELIKRSAQTTKRVEKLPTRVERPGNSESRGSNGRDEAIKRVSKSGSIDDAANAFTHFI